MCLLAFANLKKRKSSSTVREHEEEERVRAHENPHHNLQVKFVRMHPMRSENVTHQPQRGKTEERLASFTMKKHYNLMQVESWTQSFLSASAPLLSAMKLAQRSGSLRAY